MESISRPTTGFARAMAARVTTGSLSHRDLGQPQARQASTDHLPSRVNNRLHYPNGRVTDLAGHPIPKGTL